MSTRNPTDPLPQTSSDSKAAKKKRKKGAKDKANGEVSQGKTVSGATEVAEVPTDKPPGEEGEPEPEEVNQDISQSSQAFAGKDTSANPLINGAHEIGPNEPFEDARSRFEALVKDRDALRAEVTQLRQSLEELQAKHRTSLDAVSEELQGTQAEKEHAEEQYQTLLGRVNTIKAQLGERLKADAEDLAQARSRIEELEEQKTSLEERRSTQTAEVENLTSEIQAQSKELSSLRNRANLSQQNWLKEREDLIEQEAYTREQYQNAEQAMREWEVLALEERSVRKDLGDRVGDLEEQLFSLQESYEKAATDRDNQSNTVDGLQKALQEIQTARKKELRELVESSHSEAEKLRIQLSEAQKASTSATEELQVVKKELERAIPFEKVVKEKNLLIGKLRHEAVTLNEHLTKALRFLKKGKPEDNVDRQIVTNHLLHFLALDRSDPKKFQILQLIAALLGWTDEQREQAGLSRPSSSTTTSAGSLRLPHSPLVHRTPSTPTLIGDYFPDAPGGGAGGAGVGSPSSRESLAELWQSFLEQESGTSAAAAAEVGGEGGKGREKDKDQGKGKSRAGSLTQNQN